MRDNEKILKGFFASISIIGFIAVCVFIWQDEPTPIDMVAESEVVVGNVTNAEWLKIQQQKEADKKAKIKATATAIQALCDVLNALSE